MDEVSGHTPTQTPTPSQPSTDASRSVTVIDRGLAFVDAGRATVAKEPRPGVAPEANEDATICETRLGAFAVFDGMGGHAAGHVAARFAKSSALRAFQKVADAQRELRHDPDAVERYLARVLTYTHERIVRATKTRPDWRRMGTTSAIAYIVHDPATNRPKHLITANVGDSRIYRWRDGAGAVLTRDHTGIQRLMDVGQLPEQSDQIGDPEVDAWIATKSEFFRAFIAQHRNEITEHLGRTDADGNVTELHADITRHEVRTGDILIVTSDGIHDNLLDREIADIVGRSRMRPTACAAALIDAAIARSRDETHIRAKRDDMSAVVVEILAAAK